MHRLFVGALLAGLAFFNITLVEEVAQQHPLTSKLMFVVDRSGSMHGNHFNRALDAVKQVASQDFDDVEIAVIAFNDLAARWPGKPEDGDQKIPYGWAIPTPEAVEEAGDWLAELGAGGDTLIIQTMILALQEPRKELSIILVTDGLFGRERNDDILKAISDAQTWREENGFGRAVILCYGLGNFAKPLAEIGEVGCGGYLREEIPPDEPELDPMIPHLPPK